MKRKTALVLCLLHALVASSLAYAKADRPCPSCPPEEDQNAEVFDANACIGPTLSSQAAADLFCRGASRVDIAPFKYVLRMRTCNKFTQCEQWRYESPEKFTYMYGWEDARGDRLGDGGKLTLQTFYEGVQVNFAANRFNSVYEGVINHYSKTMLPSTTSPSFLPLAFAQNLQSRLPRDLGFQIPRSETYVGIAQADHFQFTDHCARFFATAKSSVKSDASWMEYQLGGLARYRPGSALRRVHGKIQSYRNHRR